MTDIQRLVQAINVLKEGENTQGACADLYTHLEKALIGAELTGADMETIVKLANPHLIVAMSQADYSHTGLYELDAGSRINLLHIAHEDFLVALHTHFPSVFIEGNHLAVTALNKSYTTLFSMLSDDDIIGTSAMNSFFILLLKATPPDHALRFKNLLENQKDEIQYILDNSVLRPLDLKALAALIATGYTFKHRPDTTNPASDWYGACELFEATSSGHARLALMAQDADVLTLLGRRFNETFYGYKITGNGTLSKV